MECLACKFTGKHVEFEKACSLGTHLWKTHGLKPQQYYDQYLAQPGDGKCRECGNPTSFRSIGQGYKEFCSKRCAAKHIASDSERNAHKSAAYKQTMQEKYSVDNGAQIEAAKEKRKDTMVKRYGVRYYSESPDFKYKYRESCLRKYGKESYALTEEYRERVLKTNNERYGADYWSKNRLQISTEYYSKEFAKYECELLEHPDKVHLTYKCNKCGNTMDDTIFFVKCRLHLNTTPCSHCFPKRNFRSCSETNLDNFVQSLGVDTSHHERWFLGEYGADIVCENEKVIIEYDGLHWHSDEYHDKGYHLAKTEYAEEMGYHLIHVFSDEWEQHEDIVKSRLCRALHKDIPGVSRKIYARDCTVAEVAPDAARTFLNASHLQGYCQDTYRYGLFKGDELVAIMTFGQSRFADGEIELLRYSNAIYTTVVGGASRLLSHYLREHPIASGEKLVTYADRRWSSANNYYPSLGFVLDRVTEPNYFYVNGNVRESRMKYQKHRLVEMGYSEEMSEKQIMESIGMHRIYDCGNYRYVWEPAGTQK